MSKKGTTKDELFLLKLHELASKRGNFQFSFHHLEIGRAIGQNDKGTVVIARDLCQANFIKKGEEDHVYLTDHGLRLVQSLIDGSL